MGMSTYQDHYEARCTTVDRLEQRSRPSKEDGKFDEEMEVMIINALDSSRGARNSYLKL